MRTDPATHQNVQSQAKGVPAELKQRTSAGVLLVSMAAVVQQVGAALAVTLWPTLGAASMVFLRFAVAGVVLGLLVRPRLRGLSLQQWANVVALAAALTAMSLFFYNATGRIPLGIAVTIEVLGPLVLSIATATGGLACLWAGLAFLGVAVLGLSSTDTRMVNPAGMMFAALAAIAWAAYILTSARATRHFPGVEALALASFIGAVGSAPLALASGTLHAATDWSVLGVMVLVALMSTVIPHSMEMLSLRRISRSTFSVLTSMAPLVAALVGLVLLNQRLTWAHYVAIALVTVASVGAVRSVRPRTGVEPPAAEDALKATSSVQEF